MKKIMFTYGLNLQDTSNLYRFRKNVATTKVIQILNIIIDMGSTNSTSTY